MTFIVWHKRPFAFRISYDFNEQSQEDEIPPIESPLQNGSNFSSTEKKNKSKHEKFSEIQEVDEDKHPKLGIGTGFDT